MPTSPPPWIEAAAVALAAVAVALVVHAIAAAVLRGVIRRENMERLGAALEAAYQPSRILIVPIALIAVLPVIALPPGLLEAAARILSMALVAALGVTLSRMADAAFAVSLARSAPAGDTDVEIRRRRTQLNLYRRLTVLTIGLITGGFILTAIPAVRSIGLSLFASAGVAGIVIGIAARPVVANFLAGLQIAISQPIRIGDAVVVEGEWGRIEEITWTYVIVEIWDQRRLVLPLSYFLEKPFQNWTRLSPQVLGSVFLYVDYEVPVDAMREALQRIVATSPLWDGRVSNLQVSDLKERTMELRALVSASDAGRAWDLRCHVREQLVAFIRERFPAALPRTRIELAGTKPDGAAAPPSAPAPQG